MKPWSNLVGSYRYTLGLGLRIPSLFEPVEVKTPGAAEEPAPSGISRGLTNPTHVFAAQRYRRSITCATIHQLPNCGRLTSARAELRFDTIAPAIVADLAGAGRGSGAGVGGSSGLGSPVSERHAASGISNRKRNSSLAGFDSSPGTIESPEAEGSEDGNHDDKRKQPVKRACNECRQQKVSYLATGNKTKPLSLASWHEFPVHRLIMNLASLQCHSRTLPAVLPL